MSAPETPLQRWQHAAGTFNALGWFLPAYIIAPAVFGLVKRIEGAPPQNRSAILADGVCELYAPRALAVMYLHRYREWPFVQEFDATILECIEAASYGFLRVATSGLAPVIEGIARGIARDHAGRVAAERLLNSPRAWREPRQL